MTANDGSAIYTIYMPFKCTNDQAQRLARYAAERHMNKSEAIRKLIGIGLDVEESVGTRNASLDMKE